MRTTPLPNSRTQDANVRLIRELKSEIKRLKAIITAAELDDSDLALGEMDLELNIHKKEEMVRAVACLSEDPFSDSFTAAVCNANCLVTDTFCRLLH